MNDVGADCMRSKGTCDDSAACQAFNRLMFASMVCRWSGGTVEQCGYTRSQAEALDMTAAYDSQADWIAALPASFTDSSTPIVFKSKGTEAGLKLHTSERYENRYCDPEDYHKVKDMEGYDNDWSDGVLHDDTAAVNS